MRTFTNEKGLSQAWVQACINFHMSYDKVGWRSVTSLLNPPRVTLLQERHEDEVVVDVSDCIWMLMGSAVHNILEASAEDEAITENRFVVPILGKDISMKPDRVEIDPTSGMGHLKDYKITRVWSYIHGPKIEYIGQTNWYAYGIEEVLGIPIHAISLEMLLRDWTKGDYLQGQNRGYPDREVVSVPIELQDKEFTRRHMEERVSLYTKCEGLGDSELPFCTEQERWARPAKWCYQKKGAKKATRLFDTQEEAQAMLDKKKPSERDGFEVVFRPGESIRCEDYCQARPWCNQYKHVISQDYDF